MPALVVCLAGSAAPALGQGQSPAPAPAPGPQQPVTSPADKYEDRPIREIRLVRPVEGKPGEVQPIEEGIVQLVRNQLRAQEGRPFRRQTVSEDISRLNRLGRFRAIRSDVQLMEDGTVVLTYTLQEQAVIEDVQVIGNRELADQDILAGVGVLAGTAVDRFQIDRGARGIEEMYRAKGFHRVRVTVDEKALEESSIVLYRVIEGERVKVTGIRFEGNNSFTPRELSSVVKTAEYIPVFEKAPLDAEVLRDDEASLVQFYRDRGYLDVRTSHRVQDSPDGREALVYFRIDEGPLYTLRSVQVVYTSGKARALYAQKVLQDPRADVGYLTADQMVKIGRRALTDEQITGLMAMKPGDAYGADKLRRSLDGIRSAYAKLGSVQDSARGPVSVGIDTRQVRDPSRPEIDLLLRIDDGDGQTTMTGAVNVIGNELTKQQVVLHEMRLRPGRPLDLDELEQSRKDLEHLQLFGTVRITPSRDTGTGERDLNVEVEEGNTGSFNIGAALGSDNGVTGRFGIVQKNFDVTDTPDSWSEFLSGRAFRGAGQTFDFELQPGTESSIYSVLLSDPTLFDTDYSGSGSIFYRDREYDEFDEVRYGARASLGRRFGTVWTGNMSVRNEWVDLSDIEPDKPTDVFKSEGLHRITGLGTQLIRNTTNDNIRPTRGSRLEVGLEQAGALGGDYDFTKFSMQYNTFLTLYESFLGNKTVLKLTNQVGYIPQGQDATPVFERFYLGGQNFRGFNFRAVSPVGTRHDNGEQSDDVIGGSWMFFAGAEINQPLYRDIVSLVTFVDTGTVQRGFGFSDYRVAAGFGFRLYIRQLSPVPLAFDFGFPIVRESTDRERVFTFTIDLPFQ